MQRNAQHGWRTESARVCSNRRGVECSALTIERVLSPQPSIPGPFSGVSAHHALQPPHEQLYIPLILHVDLDHASACGRLRIEDHHVSPILAGRLVQTYMQG